MNDARAGRPQVPPCSSFLRVPAGCEGGFPAAQRSEADAVVFDLIGPEGPGDEPDLLRSRVADAVGDLDWTGKTLAVRINAFGSAGFYGDIAALLNRGRKRIDLLIVSGIEAVPQIHTTTQILRSLVRGERMPAVELQLDSLAGFTNASLLAAPAAGAGRSLHCLNPPYPVARTGAVEEPRRRRGEQCWREAWLCAVPEAVGGSSPHEIRLIDAAPDDALDAAGFAAWTAGLAELGFHGKWTGDPARVPLCNRIFTPTPEAVEEARAVLAACDAADNDSLPAVILDGRLLDMATIRRARGVIALEGAILARRPA